MSVIVEIARRKMFNNDVIAELYEPRHHRDHRFELGTSTSSRFGSIRNIKVSASIRQIPIPRQTSFERPISRVASTAAHLNASTAVTAAAVTAATSSGTGHTGSPGNYSPNNRSAVFTFFKKGA